MQETEYKSGGQITVRVGRQTLSFSMVDSEGEVVYEPYVVKSGMSMAANLREAFRTSELLQSSSARVRVLIDSPVLMTPVEHFEESQMKINYNYTFPDNEGEEIYFNVLPDLNAVAVFSMNKDLHLVFNDHFRDVRLVAAISPVWHYLHQRSYTGSREKLYGYFHEKRLEIFSFKKNRFKFCNTFEARNARDCIYFLLYVWNQLRYSQENDEMYLVGDIPEENYIVEQLRRYVQKTYVINPSADFNRAKVTEIKGMPYDLQTLFVKGR